MLVVSSPFRDEAIFTGPSIYEYVFLRRWFLLSYSQL